MCIVNDSPVAKHLPRRLFQWRPVARRHPEILRTQQRRTGTVPRIGRSKNSGGEIYGEIQIVELVKFQIVEKYFFWYHSFYKTQINQGGFGTQNQIT